MKTLLFTLALGLFAPLTVAQQDVLVIAHRGASAYLPEHTLASKVLAHAQGADFIEQDVVMSRDDALVVLHDLILEHVSDVAERFPGRAREDGSFYVVDFDLAELRKLRLTERRDPQQPAKALYPGRFPPGTAFFSIHTLAEELQLIQGLNATLGREAGIYVELKSPWFHQQEGKDLSLAVLLELQRYGYGSKNQAVYLQSFDYLALRRVRETLLPALQMDLKLVQLIADNSWQETFVRDAQGQWQAYDYDWMSTPAGLKTLSELVDGIGPHYSLLVASNDSASSYQDTGLVAAAHSLGLQVHPFTFRAEAELLPGYASSFEEFLTIFFTGLGVDAVFTDFPDRALQLRNTLRK